MGLPVSVPEDAAAVLVPVVDPRVSVLKARPALSVVAVVGVTLPPPAVTVNVILTPETGFPPASVALTTNGLASLCPTVPVCPFPLTETRVVATGAAPLPVAVKVNGLPVSEPEDAVTVLTPAVAPRVSVVDANPEASLVAEAADKDPEPLATAKFTTVPDTPKPAWSVTCTVKGLANRVPTVPDWLLPLISVRRDAAPGVGRVPPGTKAFRLKFTADKLFDPVFTVTVFDPAVHPDSDDVTSEAPNHGIFAVASMPNRFVLVGSNCRSLVRSRWMARVCT